MLPKGIAVTKETHSSVKGNIKRREENVAGDDGFKGLLLVYPPPWLRFACHGEACGWVVEGG